MPISVILLCIQDVTKYQRVKSFCNDIKVPAFRCISSCSQLFYCHQQLITVQFFGNPHQRTLTKLRKDSHGCSYFCEVFGIELQEVTRMWQAQNFIHSTQNNILSYPRLRHRCWYSNIRVGFRYASWIWGHSLITEFQASPEHSGRKLQSFLIESCNDQLLLDTNIASVINGSPQVYFGIPHIYIAYKVTQMHEKHESIYEELRSLNSTTAFSWF